MVQDKGKLVHSHPANELTEKLFGFESVVLNRIIEDATDTFHDILSPAVPTGKIWVITNMCLFNTQGDIATRWFLGIHRNTTDYYVIYKTEATAQLYSREFTGTLILKAGDKLIASFVGVTVGEDLYFNYFGYEMNAP